jgi:hypothetical protein
MYDFNREIMAELDVTIHDEYCRKMYGERSCLLVNIVDMDGEEKLYEVRMLDKLDQRSTTTSKKYFHTLIPNLLKYKYTVVIVEIIDNNYEIMAVHLPGHLFKYSF